jgi:alpha-beta hydrolase superfamily lysophospholipase
MQRLNRSYQTAEKFNWEIYENNNKAAPTIVFAHGIAGYARILLPFVIPLFEKGYNLVVPDLQGYGYNKGMKGEFEWNSHKENLKDTVQYAKSRFMGPIFLGGASMGGPLAYAASCEVDGISGLLCWCLWDFSDKKFMQNETTTKRFTYLLLPLLRLLSRFLGGFRLKTYRLVSYDTLTDSGEFNEMVKNDPQAGTRITLKGAVSLLTQSKPACQASGLQNSGSCVAARK